MPLLQSGAAEDAIAGYLRNEIAEHFGLSPDAYDFAVVARRVRAWFDHGWRNPADPVTIFVALLDEGIDVWRPVLARPLGRKLFRIVGVDADVIDERWQFSAGAIVRCEDKQFEDGSIGETAVEQVESAG